MKMWIWTRRYESATRSERGGFHIITLPHSQAIGSSYVFQAFFQIFYHNLHIAEVWGLTEGQYFSEHVDVADLPMPPIMCVGVCCVPYQDGLQHQVSRN